MQFGSYHTGYGREELISDNPLDTTDTVDSTVDSIDTNDASELSIPSHPPTFNILCGVPTLADRYEHKLTNFGFRQDQASLLKLIIDMQPGFARDSLESLGTLRTQGNSGLRLVVVTFSSCPEYLQDLLDLQPDILIVDTQHEYDLGTLIAAAARGEQYRVMPKVETPLYSSERAVLRYLARGWSNKQIAEQLNVQDKTIINMLTGIYRKLGVKSRAEAILHYWDLWYVHKK